MTELRHDLPEVPGRIKRLPVDERGYSVPWFVQWLDADGHACEPGQGKPEFRIMDGRKLELAIKERLCWTCGLVLGGFKAFVIGPMCAVNRVSSEPPSHRDCAEFSARACPFLSRPKAKRREAGLPEGVGLDSAAGVAIPRNPGVTLVWITTYYNVFRAPRADGSGQGLLFRIGDPTETLWFAEGRTATRAEVVASIESGLPILRDIATSESPEACQALDRQVAEALEYLPTA